MHLEYLPNASAKLYLNMMLLPIFLLFFSFNSIPVSASTVIRQLIQRATTAEASAFNILRDRLTCSEGGSQTCTRGLGVSVLKSTKDNIYSYIYGS